MTEKIDNIQYCTELNRRLDEVIAWAVLNCPFADANLAYADFEKTRLAFYNVATRKVKPTANQNQPEPEDGGPQYINDNPAPWP